MLRRLEVPVDGANLSDRELDTFVAALAGDQVDPVPVALQVILFKQSMAKVGVWLVGAQGSLRSTVVLGAHARALARDDAAVAESLVARLEGDLQAVEARARPGFADRGGPANRPRRSPSFLPRGERGFH